MDTKCDLRLVEIIIKLSCILHSKVECLVSTTHRTLHIFRIIFHSIPVYFLFHFYFSLKIHKIIQLWQSLTWSCHGREAIVSNQSKLKSFVVAQMKINFKRILIYCVLFQVACFNFSSFFWFAPLIVVKSHTLALGYCVNGRAKKSVNDFLFWYQETIQTSKKVPWNAFLHKNTTGSSTKCGYFIFGVAKWRIKEQI